MNYQIDQYLIDEFYSEPIDDDIDADYLHDKAIDDSLE
jgi:hypothetical protein